MQIRVGNDNYGAFQALFNLGLIFQILLDFGLTQYNSKEVATDSKRIRVLFSSMFWTKIILISVYTTIVLAVALALGYRAAQIYLLLAVLAIQALNAMMVFLRSNVAALHHFRTDGVLAVIDRVLMILLCGALLVLPQFANDFKIEWFVWSQIFCYFLAVLIAFFVLLRLTPVPIHFSIRPKMIQKVLKHSAPYALLIFLMSIYMRADAVMIERLCGDEGKMQAGIYASAFRLLDVANILGVMFAGMLLPIFARMIAKNESINLTIRTSVNIMMPISFVVAIVALFFGKDIMYLLYHKASSPNDGLIFGLLMCSFPAFCIMYIYSTLLTANGSIRLLNKISLFIVLLNLTLHWILIQQMQAVGAAISVLITEWVVAALVIFFAHRTFHLPHNINWLATHLGFVLCIVAIAFGIIVLPISWALQLSMLVLASLFLLFVFRFWTINSFKELLSKKQSD
ncbi:MAG: oligosaccharide flippase family protein [Chitinophagaceae bacterium]|nr:oligosaccharide flippase family protein [Chitinophagaceae bacterium]